MNSGLTSERVYTALKERLLAGEFKPGDRLDPALLSDSLSSSVTPVRDVLNVLRGEGLIETRTGEGFFQPHVTAPDLEDLYGWSDQVIALALRQRQPGAFAAISSRFSESVDRVAAMFIALATSTANAEHAKAVARLNDRLRTARLAERKVLPALEKELDQLEDAVQSGQTREITRLIATYHRRRRRLASDIVRAIYRGD